MGAAIDFRVRLPLELRPDSDSEPPREYIDQYDAVLGFGDTRARTLNQLLVDMAEAEIDQAIVHAEYEFGDPADLLNVAVAELVREHPNRFYGYGTVSMEDFRTMRAVDQVREVRDLGHRGLNIQPSFFGMPIDDRRLYPVYSKATELALVVCVHTGINYSTVHPIVNDHPLQLDQVACDFPDLVLVACHGGWPWAADMVAIARKHPNVYAEFGGLAPKYVASPGTGWDVLFRFMNSLLAEQVLFATDWPVFPMDRALKEWNESPLKPAVLQLLLKGNAERLLQC